MKRSVCILMAVLLATGVEAQAQAQKNIGYEDTKLMQAVSVRGLRSMNDGEHYTVQRDEHILRYRYSDGALADTLFTSPEPKSWMQGYAMSEDESKILLTTGREQIYRHSSRAEYWVYDRESKLLKRLSERGKQQEATLSPDGKKAAFVRNNNLFVVDLKTWKESQVTTDGEPGKIINGIPDWVYEEEYSYARAYEWSSFSDAIAFCRFDESRVREYTMITDPSPERYPTLYGFKYPRAGEENSKVIVGVYDLRADELVSWIDPAGGEDDYYIPRIGWVGSRVVVHKLNRLQNHYQVWLADPWTKGHRLELLYEESDSKYIDRIDNKTLTFLPEGKGFLVQSERDGWKHLYYYDMDGRLVNRVTSGEWEVTDFYGVDARRQKVYYQSTERTPLGRDVYEIGLNGKGKRRLSGQEHGTNGSVFSKGFTYYINNFSHVSTPTRVTLNRLKNNKLIRILEDNAKLKERITEEGYRMPDVEFFTFKTSGGVELNAWMMKPADFDPARQYPVLMTQYSGPGSQRVADRWSPSWEMALLQEGIIVVCVDGRGTGFRGAEFRKCTYGNLGALEAVDQIEAAKYLKTLSYVNGDKIGIYGWSYGGFMALNCILKGADVFALAVAVAPVTSWRFYDTIYTELYNGLPQDNPAGYDDNSPINYADRLRGKLLIAHGTGDDNVHIQNTGKMIESLVAAQKDFRMLVYPDENHGMGKSRDHLMNQIIDFLKAEL